MADLALTAYDGKDRRNSERPFWCEKCVRVKMLEDTVNGTSESPGITQSLAAHTATLNQVAGGVTALKWIGCSLLLAFAGLEAGGGIAAFLGYIRGALK